MTINSFIHRLRSIFLKPDSPIELTLRTLYHRLNASRFSFFFNHLWARLSYRLWLVYQNNQNPSPDLVPTHKPKVSFVLTCSQQSKNIIQCTLQAIHNLHGNHWEVVLFSPEGFDKQDFEKPFKDDERIILAPSEQSNILNAVSGDYVIFCAPGDQFDKTLLTHFYKSLEKSPPADLTYFDCEYHLENSKKVSPLFKPPKVSKALLLSVNYLSRGIIKTETIKSFMHPIDPHEDLLAQEYKLNLWLCENNYSIRHIPRMLVSQAGLVKPDNSETRQAVIQHLSNTGLKDVSFEMTPQGTRFKWHVNKPTLSIIIPTKNNQRFLKPLLTSLVDQHSEVILNIIIVDNGSDEQETLDYYNEIAKLSIISIIPYNSPFNYSEAVNLGATASNADLVLVMNDDMQIKNPIWLEELIQWAIRKDVGIVGTKLLRSNDTIQHAGIIIGLNGIAGHIHLNTPEHYSGLFGSVDWYRDVLALTGACQMFRREVFNKVEGYDEDFKLAFGDIDFCLRVHAAGYRNIYTPFAELFHFEGKSRGYITPLKDIIKAYDILEPYLIEDDPFFTPNLTYTNIPKCALKNNSAKYKKQQIEERKAYYLSNNHLPR